MRLSEDEGVGRGTRWGLGVAMLALALGCSAPTARAQRAPSAAPAVAVAALEPLTTDAPATDALLAYREPSADATARGGAQIASLVAAPEPEAEPALASPAEVIDPRAGWAFFGRPDAPIVDALRTGRVVSAERGRGGRSLGFRLTFADGSRGYFKPDQEFNGMSWNAEIAAYHLDRELGLGRVAPVVSRRVPWSALRAAAGRDYRVEELHVAEDGSLTGAVIYWVPDRLSPVRLPDGWQRWLRVEGDPAAITPFQRPNTYTRALASRRRAPMPEEAPAPDTAERPAELSDLIVFDYLTNNLDRWGGHNTNIRTVGDGGPIMFLDNAASFTLRRPRNAMMDRRLAEVQRFRRSTIDAIRALDVAAYGERVNADEYGPLLDRTHLRNLELRRQHLLAHVDRLVAAHGEDAVYAW